LGLVAKGSRSTQTMMFKPEPLTVVKVFDTFRQIAKVFITLWLLNAWNFVYAFNWDSVNRLFVWLHRRWVGLLHVNYYRKVEKIVMKRRRIEWRHFLWRQQTVNLFT